MAADIERIEPRKAHEDLESGSAALVCGYDEPEKFQAYHLEHAVALDQFRKMANSLPKDKEVIFYCA